MKKTCPKCRLKNIRPEANFCPKCGDTIQEETFGLVWRFAFSFTVFFGLLFLIFIIVDR